MDVTPFFAKVMGIVFPEFGLGLVLYIALRSCLTPHFDTVR